MTITAYKTVEAPNRGALDDAVTAAIADDWQPYGPLIERGGVLVQALVQGTPSGDASVVADLSAIETQLGLIETWSATLATKLNADDGVLDTDFVGVDLTP